MIPPIDKGHLSAPCNCQRTPSCNISNINIVHLLVGTFEGLTLELGCWLGPCTSTYIRLWRHPRWSKTLLGRMAEPTHHHRFWSLKFSYHHLSFIHQAFRIKAPWSPLSRKCIEQSLRKPRPSNHTLNLQTEAVFPRTCSSNTIHCGQKHPQQNDLNRMDLEKRTATLTRLLSFVAHALGFGLEDVAGQALWCPNYRNSRPPDTCLAVITREYFGNFISLSASTSWAARRPNPPPTMSATYNSIMSASSY